MASGTGREVEYKIAPPESLYIIGSSSVNNPGELYVIDINSISSRMNKRNKRVMDVLCSVFILLFSPVLMLFQKNVGTFFKNIFAVLAGRRSWVSYYSQWAMGN